MKILTTVDGSELSHTVVSMLGTYANDMRAEVLLLTVVKPPAAGESEPGTTVNVGPEALGTETPEQVRSARAPAPVAGETHGQQLTRARVEAAEYLEDLAQSLRANGIGVETRVMLDANPADAIVQTAEEDDVAIIAMATHGRSGLDRLIHGSVAQAVLLSGVRPVLLVRPPEEH